MQRPVLTLLNIMCRDIGSNVIGWLTCERYIGEGFGEIISFNIRPEAQIGREFFWYAISRDVPRSMV